MGFDPRDPPGPRTAAQAAEHDRILRQMKPHDWNLANDTCQRCGTRRQDIEDNVASLRCIGNTANTTWRSPE